MGCALREFKAYSLCCTDDSISGYCSVEAGQAEQILKLSGQAGIFATRL